MKYILILIFGLTFLQACDLFQKDDYTPLIPENTPYIIGILEATEDTVHHYPEVFVGYLSQPEGFEAPYEWNVDGIWWPVTNVQVTRPATWMDFKIISDREAQVTITGPLGETNEKSVALLFNEKGIGVYGDVNYQIPIIAGKKYRLNVTMGDGRRYNAVTQIPELFKWQVPQKAFLELKLVKDGFGEYFEKEKQYLTLPFTLAKGVEYITYQENSEYDYENFNTAKGNLLFDNRGSYLRFGAAYAIYDYSDQPQLEDAIPIKWFEYYDDSEIRSSMKWWLTLNQLNKPLSNFFYEVFPRFAGADSGRYNHQYIARGNVMKNQDPSYLFDYMSNIKKIGKDGNVLRKSDALGVFGAYTAAYRRLTVIPKRSWDPDTVRKSLNKN